MTRDEQNDLILNIINSDFAKTLLTIMITAVTFSYFIFAGASDIKSQIKEVQHKIELNNVAIENRLKNVEDRQERDYKAFNEIFVKKSDLSNIKDYKGTK